jgi:hypothetical protein
MKMILMFLLSPSSFVRHSRAPSKASKKHIDKHFGYKNNEFKLA